ncbi:MAG: AAA family ATPase, partial [Coriobacteriales bacterium]|nr:AAA family ATPase [Coriobacteriales bacterium]
LLEAIAVAYGFNAEGGSKNFLFSTAKTHSELHEDIIITKGPYRPEGSYFLRAESFYNLATEIDELDGGSGGLLGGYGGVSLHHQSHGEAFLALVRNRFKPRGLYLLDEPEAALSPMNQIALLRVLHDLAECGSQLIIATHSPILLALPDAEIMLFDEGGPTEIDYEETEHYRVTRDFFENQGLFLKHLLG